MRFQVGHGPVQTDAFDHLVLSSLVGRFYEKRNRLLLRISHIHFLSFYSFSLVRYVTGCFPGNSFSRWDETCPSRRESKAEKRRRWCRLKRNLWDSADCECVFLSGYGPSYGALVRRNVVSKHTVAAPDWLCKLVLRRGGLGKRRNMRMRLYGRSSLYGVLTLVPFFRCHSPNKG